MQGRLFLLPLSLFGLLLLPACDVPSKADAGAGAASAGEAGEAGQAGEAAAVAGDDQSCTLFAGKVCAKVGEDSPTCASFKKTTALLSPNTCAAGITDIDFTLAQLDKAGEVCAELTKRLCADLGPETQTCKMVEGQTPKMPPEQCQQMADEYDKVIADLQRMEAANKPLPAEAAAKIAAAGAPSYGPDDATVTVVEFSDFQCPYCSVAATAVTEVKAKYGDRVRFVFRQFPLSFHQQAHLTAQASLAANAQGKFWEFHDKVFENQKALERANLETYAEEIGLDMDAFKKALDEGTYKATVDAELALGQEVFVSGTPTMFINGERVANATDAAAISAALDKALGS